MEKKQLKRSNTSFLPIFQMVGTKSTVDAILDLIEQKVENLKDEFSCMCTSKYLTKPFDKVDLQFFLQNANYNVKEKSFESFEVIP